MSQQLVWLGCLVNAALAGAEQGAAAAASATSRHGEVSFTGSDIVDIPSVATLRDVVFGGKEVWIIGFYLPTRCPACVSMGAEMKSAAAVLRGTGIRFGAINGKLVLSSSATIANIWLNLQAFALLLRVCILLCTDASSVGARA